MNDKYIDILHGKVDYTNNELSQLLNDKEDREFNIIAYCKYKGEYINISNCLIDKTIKRSPNQIFTKSQLYSIDSDLRFNNTLKNDSKYLNTVMTHVGGLLFHIKYICLKDNFILYLLMDKITYYET